MELMNEFVVDTLGLTLLPSYLLPITLSFSLFWFTAHYGSDILSRVFLGRIYEAYLAKEGRKGKVIWFVIGFHITSLESSSVSCTGQAISLHS